MATRRFSWLLGIILTAVLLGAVLPYIYAAGQSNQEFIFGGFLLNPIDGNSYLAKMYQGWRGDWRFTLPYSAEAGQGAYLFLYYLALGHLARLSGTSLVIFFHIARLTSIVVMLLSLYRFFITVLPYPRHRYLAFALCAVGSGLGWLAVLFGGFTSDFWVAEAYPFLSAYANPHFPLGLALLLLILTPPVVHSDDRVQSVGFWLRRQWPVIPISLALSAITPFGVVIACAVLGGMWIWAILERQAVLPAGLYLARMSWTALSGLPLLGYAVWVTYTDPYLRVWNQQNLTPSPRIIDLLISFSPLLLLAGLGSWQLIVNRRKERVGIWDNWRIPLVWATLALILVYIPLNLQRRFLMGLYVPLVALTPPGLEWLAGGNVRRYWFLAALVFFLILPTNLVVLLTARHAALTHDPAIYLFRDESLAFDWLHQQAPAGSIVLAAPQTGLLIPGYTGLGVIYGHPFETVDAKKQEQAVIDAYSGRLDAASVQAFLDETGVDFVFYGPRERSLGALPPMSGLMPVYQHGEVTIYSVVAGDVSQSEGRWRLAIR